MAVAITQTASPNGSAASSNIATYSSQSIGSASADRIVCVVVGTELTSSLPTACTINTGSGAVSMLAAVSATLGAINTQIFYLPVASGTSAEFKVTFGATNPTADQNKIAVYSVTGGSLTPAFMFFEADTDGDPITSETFTIPTNGGCLAVWAGATDTTARTWTGLTEDIDIDFTGTSASSGTFRFSTGKSVTGGSTTITVSGLNGEDTALSWIVFRPASDGTFGSVKGSALSALTGDTIDPTVPSWALNVAVGDLIYVSFGEESTTLTAVNCTDNLGNSYTALNSGSTTDRSAKSYFSICTVAGNAIPSIDTTASGNDSSAIFLAFEGPFAASPLDANPAVVIDSTSPTYSCNATGTLAQADELIIANFWNASTMTWTSPGPAGAAIARDLAEEANVLGLSVGHVVTSLVVSATTSVTMTVNGDSSTATPCSVASFKKLTGVSLSPAAADRSLSTFAPTIFRETFINPAQADRTLSTFAPSAVQDIRRDPAQTNLALSTFAPTVELTAGVYISPASANLTLSTFAPDVVRTDHQNISPAQANLTLSTTAPTVQVAQAVNISPDAGQLALSAVSPFAWVNTTEEVEPAGISGGSISASSVAGSALDHSERLPAQANLTLSAFAPSSVTDVRRDPAAGNLTLSTFAPSSTQDVRRDPAVGQLTLSTFAPSVVTDVRRDPAQANLTLSTFAPTALVGTRVEPASANLTLSTFAPAVDEDHFKFPAQADLSISTFAPTFVVGFLVAPAQANLTLSTFAPAVDEDHFKFPAQADLSLSTFAPSVTVDVRRDPAQANLALSMVAPTLTVDVRRDPAQGNLSLTTVAPSSVTDLRRDPAQTNLSLSTFAPSVDEDHFKFPAQADLTLSTFAPTAERTEHRTISPAQANLTLSSNGPSVSTEQAVPAGNLTLEGKAPTVSQDIRCDPAQANLTLSGFAPTDQIDLPRDPAQANLSLSTFAPSTTIDVRRDPASANLTLSTFAPAASIGTVREPAQANLSLSTFAPAADETHLKYPAQANLSLSTFAPTSPLGTQREPAQADLVLSGHAPTLTVDVRRQPDAGELTFTPTVPIMIREGAFDIEPATSELVLTLSTPTVVNTTEVNFGESAEGGLRRGVRPQRQGFRRELPTPAIPAWQLQNRPRGSPTAGGFLNRHREGKHR